MLSDRPGHSGGEGMRAGADPGEVKWVNFHSPLFLSPFLSLYIEIIFDFSDITTKIHPPFQNPGSALEGVRRGRVW